MEPTLLPPLTSPKDVSGCNPKKPSDLLHEFLDEQQTLSAVETFSRLHESGEVPHNAKYYSALIPTSSPKTGEQYGFRVHLDNCTGCKACVSGCHNRNGLDVDETWRSVGLLQGTSKKDIVPFQQHITTACHHCMEPACLSGCPVSAYEKNPFTGIVKHLDDQCIGCQYCLFKCPYGVPQYNEDKGIVRKCDMCVDRLSAGEAPACVQSCPNEAISIQIVKQSDVAQNPDPIFGSVQHRADYTRPTTQYVSKTKIYTSIFFSGGTPQFQHPEWPLVFMLVLTQASVGLLIIQSLFSTSSILALIAAGLGLIGLAVAPLHLGRPLYAFRVFLGLRTSWLSREAVVFGGYQGAIIGYALFKFWPQLQFIAMGLPVVKPLLMGAIAMGVAGVFSSAMIYKDTPRIWWSSNATLFKFFGTSVIAGLALTLMGIKSTADMQVICLLLPILTLSKLLLEGNIFLSLKNKDLSPLKGTAQLMLKIKGVTISRYAFGIAGGIFLPLFMLLQDSPSLLFTGGILSSLFIIGGEILERLLFFKTVVPPKMPGPK